MVLWIAMAALAAAVCLPLLLALRRAPVVGAERAAVSIYRDQLSELDRDVDRGLIRAEEAAAARTEIARRLIRADADAKATTADQPRRRNFAAVGVVAMPVAALALYLVIGSPTLPDDPLEARLAAPGNTQDIAVMVARAEQHLAQNPDDGRGWEVIAPVYMELGRADDAVKAFTNAIRVLGSNSDLEIGLGEATVEANNGSITPDAGAAFQRAHALAPDDPKPRFYLAVELEQDGKTADAIAAWQALLNGAPADADWAIMGRAELAKLQAQSPAPAPLQQAVVPPAAGAAPPSPATTAAPQPSAGSPPAAAASGPPGPSAADIAALQNLPAAQQAAMIEGMVQNLADRLQKDGSDAQGWAQLVRSYVVLGRMDDARAALSRARTALASDASKTAIVEEAAKSAGLQP
jgi:cytochrome c-type biogenesis protein CcmH